MGRWWAYSILCCVLQKSISLVNGPPSHICSHVLPLLGHPLFIALSAFSFGGKKEQHACCLCVGHCCVALLIIIGQPHAYCINPQTCSSCCEPSAYSLQEWRGSLGSNSHAGYLPILDTRQCTCDNLRSTDMKLPWKFARRPVDHLHQPPSPSLPLPQIRELPRLVWLVPESPLSKSRSSDA